MNHQTTDWSPLLFTLLATVTSAVALSLARTPGQALLYWALSVAFVVGLLLLHHLVEIRKITRGSRK